MRDAAALVLGLGLAFSATAASAMTGVPMQEQPMQEQPAAAQALRKVEYFCSDGFVPTYGGRCVATAARDEVELFVNGPAEPPVYRHHHHHYRHGVQARY